MATYSINIGTPTESAKLGSLTDVLNKLPNNSAQLIKPRDVRDAIFTTWENSVFKFNLVTTSTNPYIGFNDTFSATRNKVLLGKNKWTTQETLNGGLLSNDVDHYFFNVKDDTNPNQNTKVAFLGGTDDTLYPNAPYIEAEYISSPTRIDMAIGNPGGLIELQSDRVDIGNSGWIVDNGVLYPSIDGQSLGASPSNRIGTIYMSSTIDYLGSLEFVGTSFSSTLDDQGELTVNSIVTQDIFVSNNFQLSTSATAGYVLKSDGIGNAIWQQDSFDATGITAGWVVKADGSGNSIWSIDIVDTTGVTAGQIVVADGSGGIGYASPTTVSAQGNNGYVQFAEFGLITADSNFYWDNTNKRLGIGTTGPSYSLSVNGTSSTTNLVIDDDIYVGGRIWGSGNTFIDLNSSTKTFNLTSNTSIGVSGNLSLISTTMDFEAPTYIKFLAEEQGFEVEAIDADIRFFNSGGPSGATEIINDSSKVDLNLRQDTATASGDIASIRGMFGTNSSSNIYSSIAFSENASGGEIKFKTATTPSSSEPTQRMKISRQGYVGINKDDPMALLHVSGESVFGGAPTPVPPSDAMIIAQNNSSINDDASISIISGINGSSSIKFGDSNVHGIGIIRLDNPNNSMELGSSLYFTTFDLDNGNVGIGTNSPSEKLEVVGKIKSQTLNLSNLPTSASGLSVGDVWNDSGTLKIVPPAPSS